MKTNFFITALLLGLSISFSSCKKDSEDTDSVFNADQQVSKDQNQIDHESEDVGAMQDDLMAANEGRLFARTAVTDTVYTFPFDSCATVTLIPKGNNPTGKITVDFGTGCQGRDGRFRRGKIEWTFTDRLRKPGSVIETRFINYGVKPQNASEYINIDNSSTKTTTNLSTSEAFNDNSILLFRRDINMKLNFSDNTSFTYSGTKNLKWDLSILGYRWDNTYTLNAGSQLSGTDRQGRPWSMTVNTDVVRKAACALSGVYKPVSGTLTILHGNKTKFIDFGNGACDNSITITINGAVRRTRW
jgi:hypothetical protein